MKPLGIAVIGGGGGVGRGSHLPAIAAMPELRLVAVCDANLAAAREAAAEYDAEAYCDFAALLKRDDVDIVTIASPDFAHAQQVIAAAEAGKHILCEKPLALSMPDALQMREAVALCGVKFMAAQCMRWHPECLTLKNAVRAGKIGQPVWGYFLKKGRHFSYPEGSFYRKAESGGQFVHNGMHYVDLMCWLMESLPTSVYALSQRHYPTEDRLESDNYLAAHMRLANGASILIEMNQLMVEPGGFPDESRVSVIGTKGTIESGGPASRPMTAFSRAGLQQPVTSGVGERSPFVGELRHFAQCVRDDCEPDISMDWSLTVLEACLGAVQSARSGEVVSLRPRAAQTGKADAHGTQAERGDGR